MQVDWIKLIPALLLLLTPIGLFHDRRVRCRAVDRDWQGYWLRTLALGLHTIDLGRAALGTWLLFDALQPTPGASSLVRYSEVVIQFAVLGTATLLQSLVCREEDAAHAPFAFSAGMVLGGVPPPVAFFALVLAVALSAGANAPAMFFAILALAVSALGFLFQGKKVMFALLVVGVPLLLPWLASLLFHRHFVSSYVAQSKGASTSPLK